MARNIPPLNALRAFEATARHSSFSKAGEELNVVHTSVARHVRNLEEWLGVKLFVKSGRSIYLSEAGQRYFKGIEQLFAGLEQATSEITQAQRSKVRLSIEPIFMHQWFAKRFYSTKWADKMVGFEIEIQSSTSVSDLDKGEADLAIRYTLQPAHDIGGELISEQVMYPYLAPSTLEAGAPKSNLDILLDQSLIYSHRPERWELWLKEAGFNETPPLKLTKQDDPRVALLATFSGNAAMLLSEELMHDDVEEGRLVKISDIGLEYGRYVLLTAPSSAGRPEVQKAKSYLLDVLSTFG